MATETASPLHSKKTLLIADDEPNIRRVLQAIFTKDGYQVHVAENGMHALEVAAAHPVDVLITDLIMPDMNGVELLQKIKQRQPDVVAIMITAYATIKTCVDAMRYGAVGLYHQAFRHGRDPGRGQARRRARRRKAERRRDRRELAKRPHRTSPQPRSAPPCAKSMP